MSALHQTYREYAPHPSLANYVQCYWAIKVDAVPSQPLINRVLPDGCIDIVLHLQPDASWNARVVGTMQQPSVMLFDSPVKFIGVRFKPGGAPTFFDVSMQDLTDSAASLDTFWGSSSGLLLEQFDSAASDTPQQIRWLERTLLHHLRCSKPRVDTLVIQAVNCINANSYLSVHELAQNLAVSERQLARRFYAHIGISPKSFMRVMRFQRAFTQWQNLATFTAIESNYYDQSHFIRDFKVFTGLLPSEYL
ncbi:MAG: AraC family transcriptional regulator, partial [Burkholderiales bacterium]|nr:AraC family transcriptional regulator [Anaerolineae bacterium]